MKNIVLDKNPNVLKAYAIALDAWGGVVWMGRLENMYLPNSTERVVMHPDDAEILPALLTREAS